MDFDAKAAAWDSGRRSDRAERIAREISSLLPAGRRGAALDFGCGTGLVSFYLASRFDRVLLVDSSRGMIDVANEKIRAAGAANMAALCADITAGQGPKERFDAVYTSMALHHIADAAAAVAALAALLNPGGRLCIVDLTEDDGRFHRMEPSFDGHNGFDPAWMARRMAEAGLTDIRSRVFYAGEKNVAGEAVPYSLFSIVGSRP